MTLPTVLAFDTAGPWVAATLVRGGNVVESTSKDMPKGQAEHLMTCLEELLARHNLRWQDLDALGVGVGPGNFTGIRISVSAARGLALGLGIPAYGVDGFVQRKRALPDGAFVAVPAPRDHVYVIGSDGPILQPISALDIAPPQDPDPAALASAIAQHAAAQFPAASAPPAPLYVRPADAAPARDAAPKMLTEAP